MTICFSADYSKKKLTNCRSTPKLKLNFMKLREKPEHSIKVEMT